MLFAIKHYYHGLLGLYWEHDIGNTILFTLDSTAGNVWTTDVRQHAIEVLEQSRDMGYDVDYPACKYGSEYLFIVEFSEVD